MDVNIQLTTAGTDTGPFNLYSNVDGYLSAFQGNVSKAVLLSGITFTNVPNGTTTIRVMSDSTLCTNYTDLPITTTTTTTTGGIPTTGCFDTITLTSDVLPAEINYFQCDGITGGTEAALVNPVILTGCIDITTITSTDTFTITAVGTSCL